MVQKRAIAELLPINPPHTSRTFVNFKSLTVSPPVEEAEPYNRNFATSSPAAGAAVVSTAKGDSTCGISPKVRSSSDIATGCGDHSNTIGKSVGGLIKCAPRASSLEGCLLYKLRLLLLKLCGHASNLLLLLHVCAPQLVFRRRGRRLALKQRQCNRSSVLLPVID